jgi:hypothetical protein
MTYEAEFALHEILWQQLADDERDTLMAEVDEDRPSDECQTTIDKIGPWQPKATQTRMWPDEARSFVRSKCDQSWA